MDNYTHSQWCLFWFRRCCCCCQVHSHRSIDAYRPTRDVTDDDVTRPIDGRLGARIDRSPWTQCSVYAELKIAASAGRVSLDEKRLRTEEVKLAPTRLPSVGFRSWSRFLAVGLRVTWVINPAVGCHNFPPGPQLAPQPLRGLLPILLLGEQRHDGCEQFAYDCYPTASRLRFEPRPYCV